jgi:hypothetical protein
MGIRLKIASITLRRTKGRKIVPIIKETGPRKRWDERIRMERKMASIRLDPGPAQEIKAVSRRGLRRLKGSMGTGFPQPKRKKRSIKVPIGSRWAKGLRVNRPLNRAVGSPNRSAIQAWANSWIVTAVKRAAAQIRKEIGLEKRYCNIGVFYY